MYWPDFETVRTFYSTPLGMLVCRTLRREIRTFWPHILNNPTHNNELVAGLGYATPYLSSFLKAKNAGQSRAIALMPSAMGYRHWPKDKPNRSTSVLETHLPLADNLLDRVLIIHALEHTHDPRTMLREVWRVLAPGGKILVMVPNRRSIWARAEKTPLGHGRPFSQTQLNTLLEDSMFTLNKSKTGVLLPPCNYRFMLKTARFWEEYAPKVPLPMGGMVISEGEKTLYATTKETVKETSRAFAGAVD
jgi:SAM-dependent methyltransferase